MRERKREREWKIDIVTAWHRMASCVHKCQKKEKKRKENEKGKGEEAT